MKRYTSIVINSLLLIFGVLGLYFTVLDKNGFMNADAFLYYTVQSNIFVMLIAVLALVFEIRRLKGREIGPAVYLWRLIGAVAITLTFLVFTFMLIPSIVSKGDGDYLFSPGNLCVHNLVPIMAILDWCLCGSMRDIKQGRIYLSLLPALFYCIFALIRSSMGLTIGGNHVPYFFLDYKLYGWLGFGKPGLGVVWWILIIALMLVGISNAFAAIARKRGGKAD